MTSEVRRGTCLIVSNLKGNQEISSSEKRGRRTERQVAASEAERVPSRQVVFTRVGHSVSDYAVRFGYPLICEAERIPSPQVVFTRVGHSVSDYAVRFGYPLMRFRCPHMRLYFPNSNDFYAVLCSFLPWLKVQNLQHKFLN